MNYTTNRRCPKCGRAITGHPNKKFCNARCKDDYHNEHNPRGYGAYRQQYVDRDACDVYDDMHPFEGLNDESYK